MSHDFRYICLPYCLKKQKSGYVILNRNYKPLGFSTTNHLDYGDYPIEVTFLSMSPETAKKLSWEGSESVEHIFLYNDGCVPTDSAANMQSYLEKLQILAKLKIQDSRKINNP